MNIENITTIEHILSGIKINKLTDKKAKAVILKDYLAVRKVVKEAEAEKDEIVRKFQDDWKEAIQDESKRDDAFHDAQADTVLVLRGIDGRDVDITLDKFPSAGLYDADLWADDILLAQIPGSIDFLVENGVAE